MSGPVRPPLTVEESDGSVVVRPANTIKFNDADFTVAKSGTEATISIDSTGTGAALTRYMVGYGSASNLLTGSSLFTYDDTVGAEILSITGSGTGDLLRMESTDAAAASAPDLVFYRSSGSPAANDFLGRIDFRGKDSAGNDQNYGVISTQITTATSAGEDGNILFKAAMDGDTNLTQPGLSVKHASVVVNDGGLANMDFLVKGDSLDLISADAGLDLVGIGGSPVVDDGVLQVTSGNEIVMSITSTSSTGATLVMDAQGTGGDEWRLVSGADGAGIGGGNFGLYNRDATSYIWTAGEDGVVGIGAFPGTGAERLHVKGTGVGTLCLFESSDTGSSAAPDIVLYRGVTGADADYLGNIKYRGQNDASEDIEYIVFSSYISSAADGNEKGAGNWGVMTDGTFRNNYLGVRGDTTNVGSVTGGQVVVNEGGVDYIEFRVESDGQASLLRTSSKQDNIGIACEPSSSVERLHITGTGGTEPTVMIESTESGGAVSDPNPQLRLYNSTTGATNAQTGTLQFWGKNADGTQMEYAMIDSVIRNPAAGAESGSLEFICKLAGANQTYLRIGTAAQYIALNYAEANINTYIASNSEQLFFLDADNNNIGIGFDGAGSSGGAMLQVDDDASFLLPVGAYTANHDITAEQAHGYALQMKTGSGTGTFTLPETGVIGMQVTCVNFGAGMNVKVDASSSHKINGGGSAGNSTTATVTAAGARYDLVYIAADTWNCTAPAVVTAS